MKTKFYLLIFTFFFLCCSMQSFADVTLTTSPIAASNIAQGTNNNIIYAVKMDVTSLPVTLSSIQFTPTGTFDNNDLTVVSVFFNPTAPTLSGASLLNNATATFAASHTYNIFIGNTIAAGASGYYIIAVNTDPAATSGNTVKLNGAANPVVFSFSTSPTITNNQTDIAGTQTILAAGVTLTSQTIAASNIAQGTNNNIIYAVKMDVTSLPVTLSSIQFMPTGTFDNNDLTVVSVFFNPTAPTLSGASLLNNATATFAASHTYNIFIGNTIAAGASGYYIIAVNTDPAATSGNTVKLNGAANPVVFSFSTSPTITNNQTDIAGTQTILAAGVTLTSSAVAASNIAQGTNNNIVYAVKMDVTSLPVTLSSIQFTPTGTFDNNDLTVVSVFFNPTAPTLSGASLLNNATATFAASHTYNIFIGNTIAAGASGYYIIAVNTDPAATSGNTVKLNGAANPVVFSFSTSPTITNNQTDIAGTQTILAAGVTLTSSAVAASNIAQGTNNNIVYAVKMDVTSLPVTLSSIQFTPTGTFDNNDLTVVSVFFNPTAPTLSGASLLNNATATFAASHTYNIFIGNTIAAGASGYYIIAVNTDPAATSGNTVKLNGAANPVVFSFSTSPTITNNQTDIAGTQTILAAGVTLTSSAVAASNIAQGTNNNIVYIVKMDVTSLPVTLSGIQFTLTGTHDNNDLTIVSVFFNPTAPTLSGASLQNNAAATFAAPHTYNIFIGNTIAAGASGYYIIAVNTDPAATSGNTVKLNGAANPVVFSFSTSPTITNNQTDIAGTQTILAAGVTLTSSAVAASNIAQGTNNNIVYIVKMDVTSLPVTLSGIQFTLTGTHDNNDLTIVSVFFNPTAPTLSGASLQNNAAATFAAPHTYNIFIGNTIAAGASGYYIIAVNTDPAATSGNTVKLNGAANPVVFSFSTAPPVTNNQTDAAGTKTIGNPLPLTLTSFKGNITNKQEVQLQWITASEFNTKNFEVERSNDGTLFNKIISLPAAGNSAQNKYYNSIDKMPADGINFYRLKMIDKDGRFVYSDIIKINVALTKEKIIVFTNPVHDLLQLRVQSLKNETIVFNLLSSDGKIVSSKTFTLLKGSNNLDWNVQQLSRGNYFISSGKNFETIKIIKN